MITLFRAESYKTTFKTYGIYCLWLQDFVIFARNKLIMLQSK